jgi:hypothetical protein
MGKFDSAGYLASLPELPLAELCERLRGQYGPTSYGKAPLQVEAARRLEALTAEVERLRTGTHAAAATSSGSGSKPADSLRR